MELTEKFLPTRQSLLSRLRDWGDSTSWQEFYDTYNKLILRTAEDAGLNRSEAEEVVQETMIIVSKAIPKFRYDAARGSFKCWLRTATTWRIRDHLRQRYRSKTESLDARFAEDEVPDALEPADDPIARNWDAAWEQNLAAAAMERVKKKVPPQQFQIFDLAVIKEWPAARIAKTFRISIGYVYITKHRVSARLRGELNKLRRNPCNLTDVPRPSDALPWA